MFTSFHIYRTKWYHLLIICVYLVSVCSGNYAIEPTGSVGDVLVEVNGEVGNVVVVLEDSVGA